MKNSSATTKIVFSLFLLSMASCLVMTRVAEARGPIVTLFHCETVQDCKTGPTAFCNNCKDCRCVKYRCKCLSKANVANALINPPTTSNNNA
ncbi:hypothetical protein LINGRAHAP2_LOCUS7092 [Linum grandiflorum]